MTFNDTSTQDGLLQSCESYCNLGPTGITGDTTLKAKFTSWINQAMDKIGSAVLTVDKNWRWDDTASYGNFSVATADLVDAQRDYVLPRATNSSDISTLWKVYKVRIKDNNGTWYDLTPLASDADENNSDTQGRPTKYRLLGNSIRLSDIPDTGAVTFEEGIQVWFQRSPVKFVAGDTTKQPPFMTSFHYLLALDASANYLLPIDPNTASGYLTLFKQGLEELKTSYATRNDDPKTTKRITPYTEDTR